MKLKIYCLYDSKTESYLQPFFLEHRGDAVRGFTEAVNDPKAQVGKYPEDYTLFELGSYDGLNCKFVINSTPISIGCGIEFVKPQKLVVQ